MIPGRWQLWEGGSQLGLCKGAPFPRVGSVVLSPWGFLSPQTLGGGNADPARVIGLDLEENNAQLNHLANFAFEHGVQ